jgi:hypothetical protein
MVICGDGCLRELEKQQTHIAGLNVLGLNDFTKSSFNAMVMNMAEKRFGATATELNKETKEWAKKLIPGARVRGFCGMYRQKAWFPGIVLGPSPAMPGFFKIAYTDESGDTEDLPMLRIEYVGPPDDTSNSFLERKQGTAKAGPPKKGKNDVVIDGQKPGSRHRQPSAKALYASPPEASLKCYECSAPNVHSNKGWSLSQDGEQWICDSCWDQMQVVESS